MEAHSFDKFQPLNLTELQRFRNNFPTENNNHGTEKFVMHPNTSISLVNEHG